MKYIIANWKMNMDLSDINSWISKFSDFKKYLNADIEVIVAPSNIHIPLLFEVFNKSDIKIGAQDISTEERGAHTGETGVFQVKHFCKYSIIGHSERKETIETVIKKRDLCLKEGVVPIVCFVEPDNLQELYSKGSIMAWENPNNISKNGVYSPEEPEIIERVVKEIRKIIPSTTPLIYGGSVNQGNVEDLSKIEDLDGVLVGNASLDSNVFKDIIRCYANSLATTQN